MSRCDISRDFKCFLLHLHCYQVVIRPSMMTDLGSKSEPKQTLKPIPLTHGLRELPSWAQPRLAEPQSTCTHLAQECICCWKPWRCWVCVLCRFIIAKADWWWVLNWTYKVDKIEIFKFKYMKRRERESQAEEPFEQRQPIDQSLTETCHSFFWIYSFSFILTVLTSLKRMLIHLHILPTTVRIS